jgi:hypothetical protein
MERSCCRAFGGVPARGGPCHVAGREAVAPSPPSRRRLRLEVAVHSPAPRRTAIAPPTAALPWPPLTRGRLALRPPGCAGLPRRRLWHGPPRASDVRARCPSDRVQRQESAVVANWRGEARGSANARGALGRRGPQRRSEGLAQRATFAVPEPAMHLTPTRFSFLFAFGRGGAR